MKKLKYSALLCAVLLSVCPFAGCASSEPEMISSSSSAVHKQEQPVEEINVAVAEEADKNDTGFILNSVIDSGKKSDDGERYLYLNVTIKNTSDTAYELNALNNFYLVTSDGTEVGYDVRTQIYAASNFKGYTSNPFEIPAHGEFTGYIGGFCFPKEENEMTVYFYPTGTDDTNKSNVVKVPVTAENVIDAPADFIG
ncbi:MAG: DUF4352 domain-containing protein [Ruminococcus sp.]|nr:DUF4352 domain-containing protein [Ruminococcus sp.]MBR6385127.1 DUF4352 domain-containing protein [Ruminococcus sp.]